jgi:3-dehydroquinate dehydratase II
VRIVPKKLTIFILNGPNLNLLGEREPEVYGRDTLEDISGACTKAATAAGLRIDFRQTNHEGELVTWLQEARTAAAGVILNALRSVDVPVIEVHLSNPYRREKFRRSSFVSQAATGIICGLGGHGYVLAVEALARILAARTGG